jgi:ribose transport system permease protein
MNDKSLPLSTTRPEDTRGSGKRRGLALLDGQVRTALLLFIISAVLIMAARGLGPGFGSLEQIKAILIISSFVMVVTFGQQMVIIVGGLDLSIASMVTLGGVLAFNWIGSSGVAVIWGVPAILAVTGAIGACSGIGVAILGIPPFIMTLAMGIILYGATLGFTQGTPAGSSSPFLSALFTPTGFGAPILYLMVIGTAAGWFFQVRTTFGRKLYALGTNPTAAHVAALPVRRLLIMTYAISGASAGMAGILLDGYVNGVTLMMGLGYQLPSVAAAVIGGTAIVGGSGIYLGAVAGAILLTTLSTIVASLGIAEGWRTIVYGVVIFLALFLLRDDLEFLLGSRGRRTKKQTILRQTPEQRPDKQAFGG